MKIAKNNIPDSKLWRPVYGRFDQTIVRKRLEQLAQAGIDSAALTASAAFIEKAFADYTGKNPPKKYGFVFAIPTRITRDKDSDLSEARHFLPIVAHLSPELAQIFLSEMPPCVLDEYYDNEDNVVGAIVFVPLFLNMLRDIKPKLRVYLRSRRIIRLTSKYIQRQLMPEIVGLGATIPKITRFGKDLSAHGLRTTTGHGGTVYLIYKMFAAIAQRNQKSISTVGIVGAGSIGASSAAILLEQYADLHVIIYDTRPKILEQVVHDLNTKYGNRAMAAHSNIQVIEESSIIISAITSRIALPSDLNMKGKIIIDDSQPGSFSAADVRSKGGEVVWVVGSGLDGIYHRKTDFRFGDGGLHSSSDVWGCEAEVAVLFHEKAYDKVITAPVTPQAALAIGSLMSRYNVGIADWQMEGALVDMDT